MKTTLADGAIRHFSAEAYASRRAAEKCAQDILFETFDFENFTAATITLISGRLYLTKVGVKAGDPMGRIQLRNNAASTAGTLMKVGMFRVSTDGTQHIATCLAVSADQTAGFASGGIKTITLPYTPLEDDQLYVGQLFVGTTGPALYARLATSVAANGPNDGLTGATRGAFYNLSGQTDITVGQVYNPLAADGNSAQIYAAGRP